MYVPDLRGTEGQSYTLTGLNAIQFTSTSIEADELGWRAMCSSRGQIRRRSTFASAEATNRAQTWSGEFKFMIDSVREDENERRQSMRQRQMTPSLTAA
jgi:hypothetical protein